MSALIFTYRVKIGMILKFRERIHTGFTAFLYLINIPDPVFMDDLKWIHTRNW